MIGSTGLIEMVNAQTERVFGYTRDELLGKPVEMLVPERYRSNHPGLRTSFFANPVSRPMGAGRDLYGLMKDGSEFPVEIGLNPIDTEEGTMVLPAIVDISARKRLEDQVHAMDSMLTHMNRVATAGELSSSIAHEIKQPLAAMVIRANAGLRWLTRDTPDLDEARAAFRAIVSSGHRIAEVIESVRAMYKKNSQDKVPVDLDDLIQSVLGLMRVELEKKKIIVQNELTGPIPSVMGHGGQLQQVILNLIRNAGEAMDAVSNRERVLRVRSQFTMPTRCWCRSKTPARASILKTSTGYSNRSTPQNRMVWEWDWRFVGRSSKRIRVAFGCPPAFNMGQCFGSLCRRAV
jgi:PAS domain S-box-containing protein